jgi:glucose/arabinose dehydrogenase
LFSIASSWKEPPSQKDTAYFSQYHFGGRIKFNNGYVFFTVGDRQHEDRVQDRSNHIGSIIRLHYDGTVPKDNPFVTQNEEERNKPLAEIWSYGHRNPQGFYVHPETGELWANEHGPRGGDELNLIKKGGNYGWPEISYGFQYDGGPIGKGITSQEGMEQPAWVYVPSIAPSDLLIYEGAAFPKWKGSYFIGSLALVHLNRLAFRDGAVVLEERLVNGVLGRVRSIAADTSGYIYLGTDLGEIWRLRPR